MLLKAKTILLASLALGATAVALPAAAQQAATPPAAKPATPGGFTVGAVVSDTAGGQVGTVTKVDAQNVTVKTDKHEVALPRTSFTPTDKGLLFGMTRDQLNAAVDQQLAQAAAKMVVGATVTGSAGAMVGTIDAIDDQFVTIKLVSGALVRLPRSGIGAGPSGPVIGMTADQLEAAAKAAAPAAASTTPPTQ